jgi:hypothetical protein
LEATIKDKHSEIDELVEANSEKLDKLADDNSEKLDRLDDKIDALAEDSSERLNGLDDKIDKACTVYYAKQVDSNGDRTHDRRGAALYDEYGEQNFW